MKVTKEVTQLVVNLYRTFEFERTHKSPRVSRNRIFHRISDALGISYSMAYRIIKRREIDPSPNMEEDTKNSPKRPYHKMVFDKFNTDILIQCVQDILNKNKRPSSKRLQEDLQEKGIQASESTIQRTLRKCGFKWRYKGGASYLAGPSVVSQKERHQQRKHEQQKDEDAHIVGQDETASADIKIETGSADFKIELMPKVELLPMSGVSLDD